MSAASFNSSVLAVDGEEVALLASRCGTCSTVAFPPRLSCGRCGGACETEELPREGTIYSLVELMEPVTIHPVPSTIALVQLAHEVLVGGRLVGDGGEIGQRCRLVPLDVADGADVVTAYGFEVIADA